MQRVAASIAHSNVSTNGKLAMYSMIVDMAKMAPWGAIIPVAQFGDGLWKRRSKQHLRAEVETKIVSLTNLICSLNDGDNEFVKSKLEIERASAIESLQVLMQAPTSQNLSPTQKSVVARWFLITPPGNSAGFLLRVGFFVLLAMGASPLVRLVRGVNKHPAVQIVPAVVFVLGMAEVTRRAAVWADHQPRRQDLSPRQPSAEG